MVVLSASEIVLQYIIPSFGVIMGNIMFMAPIPDVYKATQIAHNGLGTLNPIPWAFTLGNCIGWLTYSILKQDIFLFIGNGPGLCAAVWLNLQAVKLQYHSVYMARTRESIIHAIEESVFLQESTEFFVKRNNESNDNNINDDVISDDTNSNPPSNAATNYITSVISTIVLTASAPAMIAPAHHDKLVLINVLLWLMVIGIISFTTTFTNETRDLIVGIIVNLNLFIFYAAPLSVIYTVVAQRNSSYIHICTMITNTFNGTFWAIYGLTLLDPFIYVCNGLGAVLGIIQIILCVLYPRKKKDNDDAIIASAVKNKKNHKTQSIKINSDIEEPKPSASDVLAATSIDNSNGQHQQQVLPK